MKEISKEPKQFQLPFSGKWKPAFPTMALAEGDFQVLTNMRYTDTPGIKAVAGMLPANTDPIEFPF